MKKHALMLGVLSFALVAQTPLMAQQSSKTPLKAPLKAPSKTKQNLPVLEPLPDAPRDDAGYDSNADPNYNSNIRTFDTPPNTRTFDSNPNTRNFDVGVSRIAADTYLPASFASQGEVFLDPGDSRSASLFISNDIYDSNNQIGIPRGSEVRGRFVPTRGGLKFMADAVVVRGQYYSIQASSDLLPDEKDPREYSAGAIAGDAAIGAGAGALLGLLTGGVSLGGLLGGAAASTIIGNVTAPRVVVLRPDQPLNIRLDAPVALRR
ncbi:hypothetical protein [Anthocerotibacter panamensis]|uniref:hypothetical protein n=1 Tax=Anthocerotibacter panamensis TaxID=2857077 RepID=UPI001C4033F1|nr:hypothetical protein [Anthocerotibacter panamensis]